MSRKKEKKQNDLLPKLLLLSKRRHIFILIFIIFLCLFLRLYGLERNMTFIGDQGWFYVSARDMIVNGEIPLVGITSSRIWLHQGPIWTYLLTPALFIGNFNPLSGAYLTAFLDGAAIVIVYKIGSEFFSRRFGIIASLLYSVSPALIMNSRMPYHTSPIPLFTLLLIYSVLKWVIGGNHKYFPVVIFSMSMLYNFHLSTVVFWPVIIGFLLYGLYKKLSWVQLLKRRKIVVVSFLALIVPMLPVLIYDFNNGFRQTFWYGVWFVYKPLQFIGLFPQNENEHSWNEVGLFFLEFLTKLLFSQSMIVTGILFLVTLFIVIKNIKENLLVPIGIIFLMALISVGGFFAAKTPSDAYLPMLIPALLLLFVYAITTLLNKRIVFLVLFIAIIVSTNIMHTVRSINNFGEFFQRKKAAERIITLANGREYNLKGKGPGSEFASFTMNYEYLTWWLGHGPSSNHQGLIIQVHEDGRYPEVGVTIIESQ